MNFFNVIKIARLDYDTLRTHEKTLDNLIVTFLGPIVYCLIRQLRRRWLNLL